MNRRRLVVALLIVGVAEGAILASAGFVLGVSQQLHGTGLAIVKSMFNGLGSLVPKGFVDGLVAILGLFGAGWWTQHLFRPALSAEPGGNLPALGGVLAAPAYLAVRRFSRSQPGMETDVHGSPAHRIYVAVMANSRGASNPSSWAHGLAA